MTKSSQKKMIYQAWEELMLEMRENPTPRVKVAEELLRRIVEIPVIPSECGLSGKRVKKKHEYRWANKTTRGRQGTIKKITKGQRGRKGKAHVHWDGCDFLDPMDLNSLEILS